MFYFSLRPKWRTYSKTRSRQAELIQEVFVWICYHSSIPSNMPEKDVTVKRPDAIFLPNKEIICRRLLLKASTRWLNKIIITNIYVLRKLKTDPIWLKTEIERSTSIYE